MWTKDEVKGNNGHKSARSLVKCVVCGAIFDASLDICPVCRVGTEFFVPYEEEVASFTKNTEEVYVIIGNGAAGISAAEAIRERNETASIIMISNEAVNSYNRPMLTKALSTLMSAEEIAIHDAQWYKKNKITTLLSATVDAIKLKEKTIVLSDGSSVAYNQCIYALGAECFIPSFIGSDKPQVIAIRNISDVQKIRAQKPRINSTVVIGGGVLGLEAAWEMSKSSKVTVLEVADKLMGRQLDDEAGKFLGEIILATGIDFRINANITEITGDVAVTGVKLTDGTLYPADLVIVSCGIRANSTLAKEAGIEVDRAVVVNEKMETSAPGIYACGDCAQYQGINYALWSEAIEMGKVAGANAAGDTLTYMTVPAALTFEGMNTALFAAGDNGKNVNLKYRTKEIRDEGKKKLEKYYFVEDHLVGVTLIGDNTKLADLTEALNTGRIYTEMF